MLGARMAIIDAIQKAADKAAEKNVAVTVKFKETGAFPGESIDVEITTTPQAKKE